MSRRCFVCAPESCMCDDKNSTPPKRAEKFVEDRYYEGVTDARLTLRAWLSGNQRMLFGDDASVMWTWTLAYNLAIGAALCRAFQIGGAYHIERYMTNWNGGGWSYPFEPGCGRSAP